MSTSVDIITKRVKLTCLVIDSSVAEMFAAFIEVQKNNLLRHMVVACLECFEPSLKMVSMDGQ